MIGLNGGLIGRSRSLYTNAGVWTPNEQRLSRTDPYWNDVSLLMHMNGTNNSTAFVDNSKNAFTVSAVGDAKISTAQSKFGGDSALFDGTGDYLSIPQSSAFDFGSGDFTIEAWVYATALSGNSRTIITKGWGSNPYGPFVIFYDNISAITFYASSNNAGWNIASNVAILASPSLNTWHHIAVSRQGFNIRLFGNGNLTNTITTTSALMTNSSITTIGNSNNGLYGWAGYIDEMRITKGVSRYNAAFTPPTQQFADTY